MFLVYRWGSSRLLYPFLLTLSTKVVTIKYPCTSTSMIATGRPVWFLHAMTMMIHGYQHVMCELGSLPRWPYLGYDV